MNHPGTIKKRSKNRLYSGTYYLVQPEDTIYIIQGPDNYEEVCFDQKTANQRAKRMDRRQIADEQQQTLNF